MSAPNGAGDVVEEPAVSAPSAGNGSGNKATARVLLVLDQLAAGAESYGVSELSRKLGMTKNMVHRALTTLVRHGYVVQDPVGSRYRLGPGILQLGATGLPELDLSRLCASFMRRIRDLTGETVSLAVPFGRSAVTVAGVRGRGTIARTVPTGRVIPLHVSPAARAILAYFPDDAIARYLLGPLERFTKHTLVEPEQIWHEVEAVRARGYAGVLGDHWRGTQGAAFPILASGYYPHGSITVSGPAERLSLQQVDELLPDVKNIMDELNAQASLYSSTYAAGQE